MVRATVKHPLGKGKKGEARGSIVDVAIQRKRKSGKAFTDYQKEFRWKDSKGAHRRYLRRAIAHQVEKDWLDGLLAQQIIEKYDLLERKG